MILVDIMAKRPQSILIDFDGIHDPNYPVPIAKDTDYYFEWLESHKSFHFYSCDGHFTANKDNRGYWTASRKIDGKLRRKRLGLSKDLMERHLHETANYLAHTRPTDKYCNVQWLRKRIDELETELRNAQSRIYQLEQKIESLSN